MFNTQLHIIITAQFIMIMELPCVTILMIKHGATFNTMKITMFAGLQIGIHATISPIDGIWHTMAHS